MLFSLPYISHHESAGPGAYDIHNKIFYHIDGVRGKVCRADQSFKYFPTNTDYERRYDKENKIARQTQHTLTPCCTQCGP